MNKLQIPTAPPAGTRKIDIVCHRGANEYAPENTYPSAQICIDWGMEYVEIDVNTSKDGVLYLFHGPQLERTTDGVGLFPEKTSAEIDRLDAGAWFHPQYMGERVPRLDEFLRWIRGKAKLFLDIKMADHEQLLALLRETGMEDECFFWSGDARWMRRLKEIAPSMQLKVNVASVQDVLDVHEQYGADIVEVSLANITQELIDTCRKHGIKMMAYQKEKDEAAFRQIVDWGVEMVNLNHGDIFARVATTIAAGEASE